LLKFGGSVVLVELGFIANNRCAKSIDEPTRHAVLETSVGVGVFVGHVETRLLVDEYWAAELYQESMTLGIRLQSHWADARFVDRLERESYKENWRMDDKKQNGKSIGSLTPHIFAAGFTGLSAIFAGVSWATNEHQIDRSVLVQRISTCFSVADHYYTIQKDNDTASKHFNKARVFNLDCSMRPDGELKACMSSVDKKKEFADNVSC